MRAIPALVVGALIVTISVGSAWSSGVVADGGRGLPEAQAGDWLGRVQAGIREHEYRFELGPATYRPERGQVYQAPNRALNLRLYLNDQGVEVLERSAEDPPTVLRLALVGFGREGAIDELPAGTLREDDGRAERLRDGLTETYANSAAGLELGWEIDAQPTGNGPLTTNRFTRLSP